MKNKLLITSSLAIRLTFCLCVSMLLACTSNPFITDVCDKETNKQLFSKIFNDLASEVGSSVRVESVIESKRPPMDMYCEVKFRLTDSQIINADYVIQGNGWTYQVPSQPSSNPLQIQIANYFRNKLNEQNQVAKKNRDAQVNAFLKKPVAERLQYCDIMYKLARKRGVVFDASSVDSFYNGCVYKGNQIY